MARYQIIEQGWPVGPYLIPAGAVLDTADWQWNGVRLPNREGQSTPPIDAVMCLDQAEYDGIKRLVELRTNFTLSNSDATMYSAGY